MSYKGPKEPLPPKAAPVQTSADRELKPHELTILLITGEQFPIEIMARREATLEEYAMKLGKRGVFQLRGPHVYFHPAQQIKLISWKKIEE
jgi:hypothetical protein